MDASRRGAATLGWVMVGLAGQACSSSPSSTRAGAPIDASVGASSRDASVSPDSAAPTEASAPPSDAATSDTAQAPPPDGGGATGLAAKYPCDMGITGDPAFVFGENFEEGAVSAVTSRYEAANNPPGMQLVADVPPNSCGKASMKLTSGVSANATDFYKQLTNRDELFVRWYVKYQAGITWHHAGMWFGGYQPATPYANPMAGLKPSGDDRISVAIEPAFGIGAPNPRLDTYDYWMQMHSWMDMPSGPTAYYGNSVIHQNSFTADDDAWMCLEAHVKLNTDLTSSAGAELDVWKNDVRVQHFDAATPVGYWIKDKYCPSGADGSECTDYPPPAGTTMIPLDLQWRSTAALGLNYFWPQNYITSGPDGSLQYDDMIVATARVGCLSP
jgi:hypothetical protein